MDGSKRVDYQKDMGKMLLEGDRATITQKVGKTQVLHSSVLRKDETTSPFRSGTVSQTETLQNSSQAISQLSSLPRSQIGQTQQEVYEIAERRTILENRAYH